MDRQTAGPEYIMLPLTPMLAAVRLAEVHILYGVAANTQLVLSDCVECL